MLPSSIIKFQITSVLTCRSFHISQIQDVAIATLGKFISRMNVRIGSLVTKSRYRPARLLLLRVVGHLPCDEVGRELDWQVSDKPQGRKPRENTRDGLASASYGYFKIADRFCRALIRDRWR